MGTQVMRVVGACSKARFREAPVTDGRTAPATYLFPWGPHDFECEGGRCVNTSQKKRASRSAGLRLWREYGGATFALTALEAVPKHAFSSSSQHTDGL